MRSRKEILKDLILLQGSIAILESELLEYPWDSEVPIIKIGKNDFNSVLQRAIDNGIALDVLTIWANAIECREDIEFEKDEIREIIFELANPEINGEITKERLQEIINEL
jgi:hypothetical protein